MVGRSLSEDERSAELLAVVRGLQAFFSSHGREAVFPDLSATLESLVATAVLTRNSGGRTCNPDRESS